MKRIFTLLLTALITSAGYSQASVGNPNLENWTNQVIFDSLEYWSTSAKDFIWGDGPSNFWRDDADPHHGTYSLHMETVFRWDSDAMENDTAFGYCVKERADENFVGFPYVDTVDQFTFWYKCDVEVGDSAVAIIQLSKGGSVYAETVYKMHGTVSTWTEAIVTIPDGDTEEPDSLWIGFASSDPIVPGIATEGSILEIDLVTLQWTGGTVVPTPLPNNSFEDNILIEAELPDNWDSFSDILFFLGGDHYLTKSTVASSGVASINLTVTAANVAEDIFAVVTNGSANNGGIESWGGDPFIAQPDELLFDYQYTPAGVADTAVFWVKIWNDGSGTLFEAQHIMTEATTAWDTDTLSLGLTEAPDSIRVVIIAGDQEGSELLIDNIRFQGGDLGTGSMDLFQEWGVFPNPSNGQTTVLFQDAEQITIFNLAGQEVFQQTIQDVNKIDLNTTNWPEGVYMVELRNGKTIETKKLVVTH